MHCTALNRRAAEGTGILVVEALEARTHRHTHSHTLRWTTTVACTAPENFNLPRAEEREKGGGGGVWGGEVGRKVGEEKEG